MRTNKTKNKLKERSNKIWAKINDIETKQKKKKKEKTTQRINETKNWFFEK
jgi:hypothetical protein